MNRLAFVCAWTDEQDLAFEQSEIAAKIPNGAYHGDCKLNPFWDPLRKNSRFGKLLAKLAPRDQRPESILCSPGSRIRGFDSSEPRSTAQWLVTVFGLCSSDRRFCGGWRVGSNSDCAPY